MARLAVLRPHLDDGVPLTRTAADAGVPLQTAQRWLARYRRDGMAGLARPVRCDAGGRRFSTEHRGHPVRMLLTDHYSTWALVLVASVGNVLGSCINWFLGRFIAHFEDRRWFPVKRRGHRPR